MCWHGKDRSKKRSSHCISRVFDLSARHMGGSIAQRSLLQFYFLFLIVAVGVENGFIVNPSSDLLYQDLVSKIKMDGFVYEGSKFVKCLDDMF